MWTLTDCLSGDWNDIEGPMAFNYLDVENSGVHTVRITAAQDMGMPVGTIIGDMKVYHETSKQVITFMTRHHTSLPKDQPYAVMERLNGLNVSFERLARSAVSTIRADEDALIIDTQAALIVPFLETQDQVDLYDQMVRHTLVRLAYEGIHIHVASTAPGM